MLKWETLNITKSVTDVEDLNPFCIQKVLEPVGEPVKNAFVL